MNPRRWRMAWIYWVVIFLLLLIAFLYWLLFWAGIAYTDDAYVEGNQVVITPLRDGFITAIYTDETYLVEEGQHLIDLDDTDASLAFERAKQELANTVREVNARFFDLFAAKAEIETKKANLIVAAQDYQHRLSVLAIEGVSLEDFEHALGSLRASYYSLLWSVALYDKALSLVQNRSISNHPLVIAAAEKAKEAWVQLYRCSIYSPVRGLAAQRKAQVGMWVPSGEPLMSIIPLDQIWVNANYKETQSKKMRIGQRVHLTSDLYGSKVVFHGQISGLPGGAGNAFSLLPPQNLSGNWIKIVQRLPIRVELDPNELQEHPLRIGLSMEAKVFLEDEGILIPDTNEAPCYCTPIFDAESVGDQEMVSRIIEENMDLSLSDYFNEPLAWEPGESLITGLDLKDLKLSELDKEPYGDL